MNMELPPDNPHITRQTAYILDRTARIGAQATPAVYNFPLLPEFEERVRSHFNIQEFEEAFAQGKFQDEPEEQV